MLMKKFEKDSSTVAVEYADCLSSMKMKVLYKHVPLNGQEL